MSVYERTLERQCFIAGKAVRKCANKPNVRREQKFQVSFFGRHVTSDIPSIPTTVPDRDRCGEEVASGLGSDGRNETTRDRLSQDQCLQGCPQTKAKKPFTFVVHVTACPQKCGAEARKKQGVSKLFVQIVSIKKFLAERHQENQVDEADS